MSRNQYPGICYRCQLPCAVGEGHFERLGSIWRVQHATCAIERRGTGDPRRDAHNMQWRKAAAQGTGRRAQRARKALRDAVAKDFGYLV